MHVIITGIAIVLAEDAKITGVVDAADVDAIGTTAVAATIIPEFARHTAKVTMTVSGPDMKKVSVKASAPSITVSCRSMQTRPAQITVDADPAIIK